MAGLRFLASLLLVSFIVASCQKDQAAKIQEEGNSSLLGTWELARTWGGMTPEIKYPAGNGKLLRFDISTYQHILAGQTVHEGHYQVANESIVDVNNCDTIAPTDNLPNTIIYDDEPNAFRAYFVVDGNTLTITTSCIPVDGGVSIYRRIKTH